MMTGEYRFCIQLGKFLLSIGTREAGLKRDPVSDLD